MSQEEFNKNVKGRDCEEEMPRELKAIEAELAALRPRDDRLDRERLIFLAGRASVVGQAAGGRIAPGRWAWPGAFAGMTAVAAALLLVLLVRPEPPEVERVRIVTVPAQPGPGDAADRAAEAGPAAGVASPLRQPASPPRPLVSAAPAHRAEPSPRPEWNRFGSRAEYFAMLDRMLARGVDPWTRPLPASERGFQRVEAPVPYRRSLKSLLEDQVGLEPPGEWPTGPNDSGAKS